MNKVKTLAEIRVIQKPGTQFRYKSGDTQLLGLILEAVTGTSISDYASEKLWKPLQAMHPALWSTDHDQGNEKCYCCFNSNARDFSRIGILYMHNGNWHGSQVIDSAFVAASTHANGLINPEGETVDYYGYQWWIYPDPNHHIFYARGILGQYIIVIPDKKVVLVRLGENRGAVSGHSYKEVDAMVKYVLGNF